MIPTLADGMFQRGRGLAVVKRQAPVIEVTVAGTTPPPRSKEGTHPGRFSQRAEHGNPDRVRAVEAAPVGQP